MVWQVDESGIQDAGDVGGDFQVGDAWEVRFINAELPRCSVTVKVFSAARELSLEDQQDCSHLLSVDGIFSDEHLACSYDLTSLGIEMLTEYRIHTSEDLESELVWERSDPYEAVEARSFHGDVEDCNAYARRWLKSFDPVRDISWDGRPF